MDSLEVHGWLWESIHQPPGSEQFYKYIHSKTLFSKVSLPPKHKESCVTHVMVSLEANKAQVMKVDRLIAAKGLVYLSR